MKKHFNGLWFILFAFALSCTRGTQSTKKRLVMRIREEAPTLDWTKLVDTVSLAVVYNLQEGLLRQDKDVKIVADLAESWTVSKDQKTYTFKVRSDAKWSDGVPVVAQHFADAVERSLNPTVASEYAYFLFDLVGGEDYFKGKIKDFNQVGVKVVDPLTIVFTLRAPAPYWINVPAFNTTYPVRKDLIEKYGERWTEAGKLVTTGPYKLESSERGSRMTLVKNPYYFAPKELDGAADEIEVRVIREATVAVTMFDQGQLDIVHDLPPLQVPMLEKNNPGFKKFPSYYMIAIGMGNTNPTTKDRNVRLAIAKAIDRSQVTKFMGSAVEPVQSWIPADLYGADPKRGFAFDPEGAKKIWASIKNPPKTLEFWYGSEDRQKLVAEFLQSELKKNLGLDISLNPQDWKVYLKSMAQNKLPLFRQSWAADYPDANNYLDQFTCGSGNNNMSMCNKKYDELLQQALREPDKGKRGELYGQAEKILLEVEVGMAPLFLQNELYLVNPKLRDFAPNRLMNARLVDVRF